MLFGIENWTHAFAQNGPTQMAIASVAWDMKSRRTLLWKMILAVAALKKACVQLADAPGWEIGKQALCGLFSGMEASLVEVSYPPRMPAEILAFVMEPRGHPPMEGK